MTTDALATVEVRYDLFLRYIKGLDVNRLKEKLKDCPRKSILAEAIKTLVIVS